MTSAKEVAQCVILIDYRAVKCQSSSDIKERVLYDPAWQQFKTVKGIIVNERR